jgi:hypothetical protein
MTFEFLCLRKYMITVERDMELDGSSDAMDGPSDATFRPGLGLQ